jgi:AcrR family transcriptional regulator
VAAAVAAIDDHGPSASIAEIAASAGVSKPVLYRYFADKDDLHAAVGTWGADLVLQRLLPSLSADVPLEERVRMGVDAYLATIEEHPNVFLLLVRHRVSGDTDPLADGKAAIAAAIARVMGDVLRSLDLDAGGAVPWAHGVVGLGLSIGEWWLSTRTMTRAAVSGYLTAFLWNALAGISGDYGVPLAPARPLRALPDQQEGNRS